MVLVWRAALKGTRSQSGLQELEFLAAGAITGSLLVSYTRARGESVGVICKEGLMQRAERLVLTFAACMLDRPVAAALGWTPGTLALWILGIIAAGTFMTAAHRTLWIAARLRGQ